MCKKNIFRHWNTKQNLFYRFFCDFNFFGRPQTFWYLKWLFQKTLVYFMFGALLNTPIKRRSQQLRGSVPSSHARGQRFEPRCRQYFKLLCDWSLSWFGYSSNSGILTPPLTETRQYTSMFGPQYGWAVCCVVSACDQSTLATGAEGLWWPMMVNHHSYLFTSFINRWRPSGGSWRCLTTRSDAICNIHPT